MKVKISWILLIALAVAFIQTFILKGPAINGISPNLLFLIVFLVSFYYTPSVSVASRFSTVTATRIMITNWLLGLLCDIISQSGFGTTAFLFVLTGLLISLAKQVIFKEDIGAQIIILFAGAVFYHTCYGIGLAALYGNLTFWYIIWKSIMIALYTTLVGGILIVTYKKIYWWHRMRTTQPD